MFWNLYSKYILRSLRSKEIIIWTLLFPMLLSTLFFFAFSSLDNEGILKTIPVAVVEDDAYALEIPFGMMMDELSEGEEAFLEITSVENDEDGDALLKDGKVDGLIKVSGGDPVLCVKKDGMNQTILKNVMDRYIRTRDMLVSVVEKNPEAAGKVMVSGSSLWTDSKSFMKDISFSSSKPSATVTYYYALLAMVCLYGGFHGVTVIESLQANMSPQGARNTVSPGSRGTLFGAFCLAALTCQFLCVSVGLLYIRFVLGISFGGQLGYALLTCLVGSMVGLFMGCLISMPAKWKGGMKIGMVVGVSMFCCFFAGLMISGVNYLVQEKAPFFAMINPAARIADAFYCLYYYDNHVRYFRNLGILLVMAAVMFGISMVFVRRKEYESI